MTTTAPTRRRAAAAPRVLGGLAVAAVLFVQAGFYATTTADALQAHLVVRAAAAPDAPARGAMPLELFTDLAALAPSIPPDARVLVVTASNAPVAYDFHMLPRPLRVLVALDGIAARVERMPPSAAVTQMQLWLSQMEARGQRLDAERLRAELLRADCLVTVQCEPGTLPWPQGVAPPQLIARQGFAAAWRVAAAP